MNIARSQSMPPVALIAGPTASGKSAVALRLAELAGGTVINADASQVYTDLRVLSARPSPADEAGAPHRLFGHIDGAEACTAARWADQARDAIAEAHAAGRLPILVGGSGLYIRTLLDGIAPVPQIDPAIREAVRTAPIVDAWTALRNEDRAAAESLHPNDGTRIARALEVVRSTGRTLSAWQQDRNGGIIHDIKLIPLILLPPREWLRIRCDARFDTMIDEGGIAEVEALLARRIDPALPVMRAIGVREIAMWLGGTIDRATMIARAQAATRQYAKRQFTWFTHQPPIAWPRCSHTISCDEIDKIAIKLHKNALTA